MFPHQAVRRQGVDMVSRVTVFVIVRAKASFRCHGAVIVSGVHVFVLAYTKAYISILFSCIFPHIYLRCRGADMVSKVVVFVIVRAKA